MLKFGSKGVKFISSEVPSYDRRMVLVGSAKKLRNFSGEWDWKRDIKKRLIPFYGFTEDLVENMENGSVRIDWISRKELPPAIEIGEARREFRFPVNHPIDGVMYSCSDLEPDLYVPVARFHEYMYEARMNAFVEMCQGLGAKEIRVIYAEENGMDVTAKVKGKNIPTSKGKLNVDSNGSYNTESTTDANIFYSFDPPTKPMAPYNKAWINAEPTWQSLQNFRLDGSANRSNAEFNHSDEMTITGDLAASLNGLGLSIGGSYSPIVKKKFIFQIEFWPKE